MQKAFGIGAALCYNYFMYVPRRKNAARRVMPAGAGPGEERRFYEFL
jgi:hypothetical protein